MANFDGALFVGHGKGKRGVYDPGSCKNGYEEHKIAQDIVNNALSKLRQKGLNIHTGVQNYEDSLVIGNVYSLRYAMTVHLDAGGGVRSTIYTPCKDKNLDIEFYAIEEMKKLGMGSASSVKSRDYDSERYLERINGVALPYNDYYKEINVAYGQGVSLDIFEVGYIDSSNLNTILRNIDKLGSIVANVFLKLAGKDLFDISNNNDIGLKFSLDEPSDTKIIDSDSLKVRGWSLNHKKIEVLIDGANYGSIETGKQREDVYKAYPQYNNHFAGFETVINFKGITNGDHKCTLRVTDNNNKIHEVTKWFNIVKPLRIALDTPNNETVTKGNINVSGWALTGFHKGIEFIEIFINNTSFGQANKGLTREDVGKIYPWYYNSNRSGYNLSIPVSGLNNGDYTIKAVIKADKEIKEATRNFKINKPLDCNKCENLEKENKELKETIERVKEVVK